MDEAAARRQRLAALRDRAAGAAATDRSGERELVAHGNLRNPFDDEARPQEPGPSFNYYSNPLAAFQPRVKSAMPRLPRPQHDVVTPMFARGDDRGFRPPQQAPFSQQQVSYVQGFRGKPAPYPPGPFPPAFHPGPQYPGPGRVLHEQPRPFGSAPRGAAVGGTRGQGRGWPGQWEHGNTGQGPLKFPRVEGAPDFGRGRGNSQNGKGGVGGQGRGYYKPSMVEDPWARLLAAKGIQNVPPPLAAPSCFCAGTDDTNSAAGGTDLAATDVPLAAEIAGRVGLQLPRPKSSLEDILESNLDGAHESSSSAAGMGGERASVQSLAETLEVAMSEVRNT